MIIHLIKRAVIHLTALIQNGPEASFYNKPYRLLGSRNVGREPCYENVCHRIVPAIGFAEMPYTILRGAKA